jgi:hypothetical protein
MESAIICLNESSYFSDPNCDLLKANEIIVQAESE